MNKRDLESIKRGMAQAKAYLAGEREGFRAHEPVNIRKMRAALNLTQRDFAERFRLNPRTVEQWEQGRSHPDLGTETYLRLIESHPQQIAAMVSELASS